MSPAGWSQYVSLSRVRDCFGEIGITQIDQDFTRSGLWSFQSLDFGRNLARFIIYASFVLLRYIRHFVRESVSDVNIKYQKVIGSKERVQLLLPRLSIYIL